MRHGYQIQYQNVHPFVNLFGILKDLNIMLLSQISDTIYIRSIPIYCMVLLSKKWEGERNENRKLQDEKWAYGFHLPARLTPGRKIIPESPGRISRCLVKPTKVYNTRIVLFRCIVGWVITDNTGRKMRPFNHLIFQVWRYASGKIQMVVGFLSSTRL